MDATSFVQYHNYVQGCTENMASKGAEWTNRTLVRLVSAACWPGVKLHFTIIIIMKSAALVNSLLD